MSASIVKRNNVVAGIFVIASLVLAVVIAVILGDVLGGLGKKNEFVVRFPSTVGVTGLETGAEVTFAGLQVGSVGSIRPYAPGGPGSPPEAMDVVVQIDDDIRLFENTVADLTPPILGGISRINFTTPGTGPVEPGWEHAGLTESDGDGVLEPGEVIAGRFAPSILAQLGFTPEDARNIQVTIANARELSERARTTIESVERMVAEFEPRFGAMLDDAGGAVSNARGFTDRLIEGGDWSDRVTGILDKADRAAGEAPEVMGDLREAIASARSVIDEQKDRIARITENIEAVTERARFQSMDRVEELLEQGTLALATYRSVGEQADALLAQARPDVTAVLGNTRSMTRKATIMIDELRAAPWRVLKEPPRRELERQPLYAAARTYADAVADLRAASEALDAAVRPRGPDASASAETADEIARIAGVVQAAYDRYAEAERALLETLREPNQ